MVKIRVGSFLSCLLQGQGDRQHGRKGAEPQRVRGEGTSCRLCTSPVLGPCRHCLPSFSRGPWDSGLNHLYLTDVLQRRVQ